MALCIRLDYHISEDSPASQSVVAGYIRESLTFSLTREFYTDISVLVGYYCMHNLGFICAFHYICTRYVFPPPIWLIIIEF